MNKKMIGWMVFTGWLLIIGIGIIRAMYVESHKDEQDVIEAPVSAEQGGVISSRSAGLNHLTG